MTLLHKPASGGGTANSEAESGTESQRAGPLVGIKVLDISTFIAGPMAATLMADFGAEVLKVEMPGTGDPLRNLPPHKDGICLWNTVANRNKRSVSLDIRTEEGREILERLIGQHDVLVENFRPGTLASWGLPPERLKALNPKLITLRVTGFGQDGPYARKPGVARIFEALSGLVHLSGEPEGPPMFQNWAISDAITAVFGAFALCAALRHRELSADGQGQEIDLSATEACLRLMDVVAVEYDQTGRARSRVGNTNYLSAPGGVYRTVDNRWVVLTTSAPSMFGRLARAIGREDLLADQRFQTHGGRIEHREELEAITREWFVSRTLAEVSEAMEQSEVTCAPIYDIEDVFADPHFQQRGSIISVEHPDLGPVAMPEVVPRFSVTPGRVWSAGPDVGQHNLDVLMTELGYSQEQVAVLREKKII